MSEHPDPPKAEEPSSSGGGVRHRVLVAAVVLMVTGVAVAGLLTLRPPGKGMHAGAMSTPLQAAQTASAAPVATVMPAAPVADAHSPNPPHFGRNGPLTPREMNMARAAWNYFVHATQEKTGLANAVGSYPSTTMWDTASYISGLVSAFELGIIEKREFDQRMFKLLSTLHDLSLFRGEMPNKVYQTQTGAKVDYGNQPGEVGFSANDIGRMLIWLQIVKQRYPYMANSVDGVVLQWNFCNTIDSHGWMQGAAVGPDKKTIYFQEGRLGYEEYSAKGFGLWGFNTKAASDAQPYAMTDIYGIRVPYDARDPRKFQTENYVLSEGYILDGIETNFDIPGSDYADVSLHTDGWRAEFASRVYMAQQKRFEETGILTARTEHQVDGAPYFVYDTVFADGYAWNTLSPTNAYVPERAAIAVKGALGLWVLWQTPYTDKLFDAVADLYTPDGGFYEGLYENGKGYIPLQTANNNGIILAILLYKVQGPILRYENRDQQLWWTAMKDGGDDRQKRCLPVKAAVAECSCPNACSDPEPIALKSEEYVYCEPVPASKWYPGCACAHPEPAARNCSTTPLKTVIFSRPLPGSFCKMKEPS